jgi:hypothetical protein
VDVNINPELGLDLDGTPHVIKLYFKAERLPRNRAEIILHLMNTSLCDDGCVRTFAVLDIRSARLITSTGDPALLGHMLEAELGYIADLWPHL